MQDTIPCPICNNADGNECRMVSQGPTVSQFGCDVCGNFRLDRTVHIRYFDPETSPLTKMQRALLSHRVRAANEQGETPPIAPDWVKHSIENGALPSPGIQAINIIRFVGDEVSRTGKPLKRFPPKLGALIGAPSYESAARLAVEIHDIGWFKAISANGDLLNIDLTLAGWDRYEAEARGEIAGKSGFIAMQFNDPILDPFIRDVVKPAIKSAIGYDLVDMRGISRAGVIDNIMRAQIRDSAFVIVDLTHDNYGAYWEAGYAEGLGKDVIYICKKEKFDEAKTHFDTNHCTTVMWSIEEPDAFVAELIATLRRSLNLFEAKS